MSNQGVTGLLGGGGSHCHLSQFFPSMILAFFQVEISDFIDKKKNFQWFPKSEKSKKEGKVLDLLFFPITPSFPSFLFSSTFSIFYLTSLPRFSRLVGKKSLVGNVPPAPSPSPPHVTPLCVNIACYA